VECHKVECFIDQVERSFNVVAAFGNNVEAMFGFVPKTATFDIVACCFDNFASSLLLDVDGALWPVTILYRRTGIRPVWGGHPYRNQSFIYYATKAAHITLHI